MVDFSDHHGGAPASLWMGNFRCVQDTDDAFECTGIFNNHISDCTDVWLYSFLYSQGKTAWCEERTAFELYLCDDAGF